MKIRFLSVAALMLTAGMASVAQAAPPVDGDLIFTDAFSHAVYHLPMGGPASLLFSSPTSRLAGITHNGGEFYFADGPFPVGSPSQSRIIKATSLFSGAPVVSDLASSGDIQNPIGLTYQSSTNSIIGVMNPAAPVPYFRGLLSVSASGGGTNRLFEEPTPSITPAPRYNAGTYVVQDKLRADRFLVTTTNGGIDTPDPTQDNLVASTLHAFTINSSLTTTHDYIYDFSDSSTHLGYSLFEVRGIAINGSEAYVSDILRGEIYKLALDGSGAVSGISLIKSGLDQPENILFNPITGKLVIDEVGGLDPARARISQISPDGSGYEVLALGFHARGFDIVPAPGTLALLGMGGLVASRRRRA